MKRRCEVSLRDFRGWLTGKGLHKSVPEERGQARLPDPELIAVEICDLTKEWLSA
jgi:hypothetical protein